MKSKGKDTAKPKKRTPAKHKKVLDVLWAQIIKHNWHGLCGVCGKAGSSSHHFFGKKSSPMTRFEPNNGIYLCFYDHIGRIHQQGDTEPAREKIIAKIGQDSFDVLKFKAKSSGKQDLNLVEERLRKIISNRLPDFDNLPF